MPITRTTATPIVIPRRGSAHGRGCSVVDIRRHQAGSQLASVGAGSPRRARIVDRIVVADQLIREREANIRLARPHADALLARPSAWAGYGGTGLVS